MPIEKPSPPMHVARRDRGTPCQLTARVHGSKRGGRSAAAPPLPMRWPYAGETTCYRPFRCGLKDPKQKKNSPTDPPDVSCARAAAAVRKDPPGWIREARETTEAEEEYRLVCFFFVSPKGWLRALPLVDGAVLSPDTRQGGCVRRTLITHALVVGKKHRRQVSHCA